MCRGDAKGLCHHAKHSGELNALTKRGKPAHCVSSKLLKMCMLSQHLEGSIFLFDSTRSLN